MNLRAKAVEQSGLEEDISLFKRSLFEGTELFFGGVCVGFWNLGCRSCRTKRVDMMFFLEMFAMMTIVIITVMVAVSSLSYNSTTCGRYMVPMITTISISYT